MGRCAEGWSLWWDKRYSPPLAYVRFTWGIDPKTGKSKRHLIPTGKSDQRPAEKEARRIHALVVSGQWRQVVSTPSKLPALPVDDLTGKWLVAFAKTHPNSDTAKNWETYAAQWPVIFGETLDCITPDAIAAWATDRLSKVKRVSHRKERSALRVFLRWCVAERHCAKEAMPVVPELPKDLKGVTANPKRKTKAVPLTIEEVEKMLAMMPEYARNTSRSTGRRAAVRDFAIAQYETTLRPRTLQRIVRGTHFDVGWATLRITSDVDKVAYDRDVNLTRRAREVLDRQTATVAEGAPIFGAHDIRGYYRAAAKAAGIAPEKAARVSRYDLRHAGGTHTAEASNDLLGTGYLMGHRLATTTDRYLHGGKRAGDRAVEARQGAHSGYDSGCVVGTGEKWPCVPADGTEKAREFCSRALSGRVDSNHRPLDPQSRPAFCNAPTLPFFSGVTGYSPRARTRQAPPSRLFRGCSIQNRAGRLRASPRPDSLALPRHPGGAR